MHGQTAEYVAPFEGDLVVGSPGMWPPDLKGRNTPSELHLSGGFSPHMFPNNHLFGLSRPVVPLRLTLVAAELHGKVAVALRVKGRGFSPLLWSPQSNFRAHYAREGNATAPLIPPFYAKEPTQNTLEQMFVAISRTVGTRDRLFGFADAAVP